MRRAKTRCSCLLYVCPACITLCGKLAAAALRRYVGRQIRFIWFLTVDSQNSTAPGAFEDARFSFRGQHFLVLDETGLVLSVSPAAQQQPDAAQVCNVALFRFDGAKERHCAIAPEMSLQRGQVISIVGIARNTARDDGQFVMIPHLLINHTGGTTETLCPAEALQEQLGLAAEPFSALFVFFFCLLVGGLVSFFVLGSLSVFGYALVTAFCVACATKVYDWYRCAKCNKDFAATLHEALGRQKNMIARLVRENAARSGRF